MVIGDVNARIGNKQIVTDKFNFIGTDILSARNSKDQTVNRNGRLLIEMCQANDLFILNGCSKNDSLGEYTFIGGSGKSVIDICAVSSEWMKMNLSLQVGVKTFSDHMPLVVELSLNNTAAHHEIPLPPKLVWKDNLSSLYRTKLLNKIQNTNVSTLENLAEEKICFLNNCIKQVVSVKNLSTFTKCRQKWFDQECLSARKVSFDLLRKLKKAIGDRNDTLRTSYITANKYYKELCHMKRKNYFSSIALELSRTKDSKSFWEKIKSLKGLDFICGIHLSAGKLAEHFKVLLNPYHSKECNFQYAEPFVTNDLLDSEITMNELQLSLYTAKNRKAPGPDRISNEFYKNAPHEFLIHMLDAFNFIYNTGNVPQVFKEAIVYPIYKKGDVNLSTNYRGISFMNSTAKIFSSILLNRMNEWIDRNDVLSEYQAGFRKGYSTIDNIFTLTTIAQFFLRQHRKLYIFFVDFKAAFDSIDRGALFYKLSQQGLSTKLLKVLKSMYKNTRQTVWDGKHTSEWFGTTSGVKQGCLLSAVLFSLFIDDISAYLPAGVSIADIKIKVLLYADDIVLFAEYPHSMQLMINKLSEFCKTWNLAVNLEKSKIMIIRNRQTKLGIQEKWYFDGEEIETVTQYKYLGVILNANMSFSCHLETKLTASKNLINASWKNVLGNNEIITSAKYKVFESIMRSVMCYSCQTWGYRPYEEVEKLLRYFLKKLFRMPINTPNYVLMLETGLPSLYNFTLKLHFDFILKTLRSPMSRIPHILARNVIDRKMEWADEWKTLSDKCRYNLNMQYGDQGELKRSLYKLLEIHDIQQRNEYIQQATQSINRMIYPELNFNLNSNNYFSDSIGIPSISLICRARCDMLNLNGSTFINKESNLCTICNMKAKEDTFHFLAICPIYRDIRYIYFRKLTLTMEQAKTILNGPNWVALFNYLSAALKYRHDISTEYR